MPPPAFLLDDEEGIRLALRAVREYAGVELAEAAAAVGVGSALLERIEKGTSAPSAVLLVRLLGCYGYRLAALSLNSSAIPRGNR